MKRLTYSYKQREANEICRNLKIKKGVMVEDIDNKTFYTIISILLFMIATLLLKTG